MVLGELRFFCNTELILMLEMDIVCIPVKKQRIVQISAGRDCKGSPHPSPCPKAGSALTKPFLTDVCLACSQKHPADIPQPPSVIAVTYSEIPELSSTYVLSYFKYKDEACINL